MTNQRNLDKFLIWRYYHKSNPDAFVKYYFPDLKLTLLQRLSLKISLKTTNVKEKLIDSVITGFKLLNKVQDFYYNTKNGIHNLIRWIPIIWKIRDWDAQYLYPLIHKHLTHVEDCLRYYGHAVNSIKYADRAKVAKNLSKRLMEDNYTDNALTPVEQKYGELEWSFEDVEGDGLRRMIFNEINEEKTARYRAYEHSELMRKQDKEMLFNYLNKYIDKWWD